MSFNTTELGIRLSNYCDSMEKELVSRCIKVFRFEPHSKRKIIMILGQVTVTIIIPVTGKVERQFTEDFKKPICMMGLSGSANSEKIATEVLIMCPFIDNSMRQSLVDVIEELKSRDYDQNGIVVQRETAADGSFLPRFTECFDDIGDENDFVASNEEPDFAKLDHYVDSLYEDISQKIEASDCLAKLTKCNSYLKDISRHESAINALFRTLREDSKKSSAVTKNILTICLNFAKVRDFHGLLINHKIPMLTLEIIDFELERCEKWKTQLIEFEATASKNRALSARSLNDCQMMWVRLTELTNFQNGFLKIAFEILYCLSEDKGVREKLFQHKVITSLSDALERRDNELLEVLTGFLKNLSCFKQCIDEMIAVEVINKLATLLKEGTPISKKVVGNALHLLYNVSFCSHLRQKICDCGFISIIANCFDKSMFREITAKTLYVLSMDPAIRIKLAKSTIIESLMKYLTEDSEPVSTTTTAVASLVLNISRSNRGAKLIWETGKLGSLIQHAIRHQDFFAMKIVRSLAEHDVAFILYESEYAGGIAGAMANSMDQEFVMECIGILTCLDLQRVAVDSIIHKGKIFPWLKQTLGYYLDKMNKLAIDVTFNLTRASIDVILLLSNICTVEEGCRLVVAEGFMDVLMKIVHSGSNNDESVIDHIFFCLETCTKHESISIYLATKSLIVASGLLEFAESTLVGKWRHKSIVILEQIGRFDETWKENVQQFNFLSSNKDWIDSVTESQNECSILDSHQFKFQDNSCAKSRDAICSLQNVNSESSDDFDDQEIWSSENDSECRDSEVFGMFRHQFEEEMGFKSSSNHVTEYWIDDTSDPENDWETLAHNKLSFNPF